MRKAYLFLLLAMAVLLGCQQLMRPADEHREEQQLVVDRYDRIESLYLTMADFASLHQMRTDYPLQTRTLIEEVLQLGPASDPDINNRLLLFYQDSTLQTIITDVGRRYENTDILQRQLAHAFKRLSGLLPDMRMPRVYTQIGALAQSIVVTDTLLGISLDKYLGADYPAYLRYGYSEAQRRMMTPEYIVPDCLGFYLLSLYPMPDPVASQSSRNHAHMMRIQAVVNSVMGQRVFQSDGVSRLEAYWRSHHDLSADEFLLLDGNL